MQLIPIEAANARLEAPHGDGAQRALAGVISNLGDARFGTSALAQLNEWLPLCWWSVYRLFDDAPPTMHASGSFGVADGTQDSFHSYRAGLYRRDQTFDGAWTSVRDGNPVMIHWDAREIPAAHRQQIYSRHKLRERLSLVTGGDSPGLLAVNLYRHEAQDAFTDETIDAVRRFARPLLACVVKHVAMVETSPGRTSSGNEVPNLALGSLTGREMEVCQRLLKGWTHEGIAADLGLSPGTVKTYRDRAFDKLGIHHRNELFALAIGSLRP
jgi:DNA-binding CsgD family transcriptional regulator